jgi:hypothetical protein
MKLFTSGFGTFETCRRTFRMSVDRGKAEVGRERANRRD